MKGFGKIKKIAGNIMNTYDSHQREVKLGMTVTGVVITGISAARAGIKAYKIISEQKDKIDKLNYNADNMTEEDYNEKKKEVTVKTVKRVAPVVIPPVVIGSATIWSAVSGYNAASKQIAALSAAYSLTENSLNQFKEKATELLGEKKAQELNDQVNIAGMNSAYNAGGKDEIIETGKGNVLFYDRITGTFFRSNWESIRAAVNTVVDNWVNDLYDYYDDNEVPYGEFLEELNLNVDGNRSLAADAFVFKADDHGRKQIKLRTTSLDHITFDETKESATVIDFMTQPSISYRWIKR